MRGMLPNRVKEISKKLVRTRLLFLFLALLFFSYGFFRPILIIANRERIKLTPFLYPLLMNDHVANLALKSLFLPFLCTILVDGKEPLRQNKHELQAKISTNLITIFLTSVVYSFAVQVASVLLIAPVVEWSVVWGNGWETLMSPESVIKHGSAFLANSELIGKFTALGAYITSSAFDVLSLCFLGIVLLVVQETSNQAVGVIVASVFLILDMSIQNLLPPFFSKVSPLTRSMLAEPNEMVGYIDADLKSSIVFFAMSISMMVIWIVVYIKLYIRRLKLE